MSSTLLLDVSGFSCNRLLISSIQLMLVIFLQQATGLFHTVDVSGFSCNRLLMSSILLMLVDFPATGYTFLPQSWLLAGFAESATYYWLLLSRQLIFSGITCWNRLISSMFTIKVIVLVGFPCSNLLICSFLTCFLHPPPPPSVCLIYLSLWTVPVLLAMHPFKYGSQCRLIVHIYISLC